MLTKTDLLIIAAMTVPFLLALAAVAVADAREKLDVAQWYPGHTFDHEQDLP